MKSAEIEKMIRNVDAKIEYFRSLQNYAEGEIEKLLDAKGNLLVMYAEDET